MHSKEVGETDLIELMVRHYGTKQTALYYLKKTKEAAARARVAISTQNTSAIGAEAQQMIINTEILYKILADDTKTIDENRTKHEQ